MHLTKARTKHNTACQLNLPSFTINPSPSAHVLGSLSTKHSTGSHTCNTTSPSWKFRPTSSKGLRPQHGAPPYRSRGCSILPLSAQPSQLAARHGGFSSKCYSFENGVGEELQKAENQCLRTVAGAYKAIPIQSLQAEVRVSLLPLHMDSRPARF